MLEWTKLQLFIPLFLGTQGFTLRHRDLHRALALEHPHESLPVCVGGIEERVNPLTKTSRTRNADEVITARHDLHSVLSSAHIATPVRQN